MFAPSRSLLLFLRQSKPSKCPFVKSSCFSTSTTSYSGHSRWSKIKHDKAVVDNKKNKARTLITRDIELASKFAGPDPELNPRLKSILQDAKRSGFPKESIEAAIKRGQGLSTSGRPLEAVTVEAVFPPGVAAIIECLTESKLATLAEVRNVVHKNGGQVSPCAYLFDRKGRVVFREMDSVEMDDVMEFALEQEGFEDINEEDGKISIMTEPSATKVVADSLATKFGLEIEALDMEWQPNSEVDVQGEEAEILDCAMDRLRDIATVQNVYLNAAEVDAGAVT